MREPTWGSVKRNSMALQMLTEKRLQNMPSWPFETVQDGLKMKLINAYRSIGREALSKQFKKDVEFSESNYLMVYPSFYLKWVSDSLNPTNLKFHDNLPFDVILKASQLGYMGDNIEVDDYGDQSVKGLLYPSSLVDSEWYYSHLSHLAETNLFRVGRGSEITVDMSKLREERLGDIPLEAFEVFEFGKPFGRMYISRDFKVTATKGIPEKIQLEVFEAYLKTVYDESILPLHVKNFRPCDSASWVRSLTDVKRSMLIHSNIVSSVKGEIRMGDGSTHSVGALTVQDGVVVAKTDYTGSIHPDVNMAIVFSQIFGRDLK